MTGAEWLALIMLISFFIVLWSGYPVALGFAGVGFIFGILGVFFGVFELNRMSILFSQWFRAIDDFTLLALPFFIFMGSILGKAGLAEKMLTTLSLLLGRMRGGLGLTVVLVGGLLAAATGVVAFSVAVMGALSLPKMIKYGYDKRLASGLITASGSLAQLVPPSVILILLADMVGISIGNLFTAAVVPGVIIAILYGAWVIIRAYSNPEAAPALPKEAITIQGWRLVLNVAFTAGPIILLVLAVFGSVVAGIATPTESGAVGSVGAMILVAANGRLNFKVLYETARDAALGSSLIMFMLYTSLLFQFVFDHLGGHDLFVRWFDNIPGGFWSFVIVYVLVVFILGLYMEYQDIIFLVVPIALPVMVFFHSNGTTPFGGLESLLIWFTVLTGISLNISFISPPVGFSLAYLRNVAPPEVETRDIYGGSWPFMALQSVTLAILLLWPQTVSWLPEVITI